MWSQVKSPLFILIFIQYWLCQSSCTVSNIKIVCQYCKRTITKSHFFQLKSIHDSVIIQFSSLPIVSVQSVKRPQLSKPKVTAARTQNSIVDGNGEKTLENQAQSGGQFVQRTCLVPMVLCWCYICNSVLPFLQIWWRNKLIYISDGLSVSKFLPKSSPKLQLPTIIVAVRCICNVMFNNKNISVFACAQWKSPSCIDHQLMVQMTEVNEVKRRPSHMRL